MSTIKLLKAGLTPWARSRALRRPLDRSLRHISTSGGLLQRSAGLRNAQSRSWPLGAYAIHNVPAVRTISFARALPKLATKLLRIPAMFGGAAIAGLAYIQYQATREFLV